jgi:hypothetical protein
MKGWIKMEVTDHIEQLNKAIIRVLRRLSNVKDEKQKQKEMLKIDLYTWALNEYLKTIKESA